MKRYLPIAILIAALLIDALLCGFTSGAILVSSGTAFYQGWAGLNLASQANQQGSLSAPTYLPLPTYTLLPTHTPYPTTTSSSPGPEPVSPIPADDLMPVPGVYPTPELQDETITYEVQDGDTIESIATDFDLDPQDLIAANALDPASPQINVGDILIIPQENRPTLTPTLATPDPAPAGTNVYPGVPALPGAYPTP